MTFLAIISLQSQNLANFAQLIKLRATYLYQTSSVAIGFPLSSPPITLVFFDIWDVFHFLLPYLYMGRYRCKEWKIRDKMYFPEKQTLILQIKESKTEWLRINIPRKYFTLFALRCGFCPQRKFPNFRVLRCVPQGKECFSRTYAREYNSDFTFLLSQVSQRAKNESSIRPLMRVQFVPLKVLFFQKQRVVFNKTTYRFQ